MENVEYFPEFWLFAQTNKDLGRVTHNTVEGVVSGPHPRKTPGLPVPKSAPVVPPRTQAIIGGGWAAQLRGHGKCRIFS